MESAVIPFRDNFLPWCEQRLRIPRAELTIKEELPDRLFFEDPCALVMQAFLAAVRKPIIAQPSNHGKWVCLSIRYTDAPSCQLIVCRRLINGTMPNPRYQLFYGVDFDHAPWTPERLDWLVLHGVEVLRNKASGELTDQAKIRFGLQEDGIIFA